MVRMNLYRKLVARLLILIYLLIGVGISNNLLWCQDAEASFHVEYNPAGECQVVLDDCSSVDDNRSNEIPLSLAPILSTATGDCQDTPTSFSHTLKPETKDLLSGPLAVGWPAFQVLPIRGLPVFSLAMLNLRVQPPPSQAHIAQRTTVLLH